MTHDAFVFACWFYAGAFLLLLLFGCLFFRTKVEKEKWFWTGAMTFVAIATFLKIVSQVFS